jgi:cytochrome c5
MTDEGQRELAEFMAQAARAPGGKPIVYKSVPQGAATSIWAAAVAKADAVGGRYCEDCHVADVVDAPGFTNAGVRPYALNPETAKALWAKSEELIGERF